jgi:O-antigen ligase/tetratricopeptide (TPR) repeat protein
LKRFSFAQILLVIAAFLAPIIGGQLNTEATALAPGGLTLFRSIFSGVDETVSYFYRAYQPLAAIETPTLSHALVGLFIAAAFVSILVRRKVFQVPLLRVSVPLLCLVGWLIVTLSFTQFLSVSLVAVSEWLIFATAFFAVIAAAGRRRGTFVLIAALVAGCTVVAVKGLCEYGAERSVDPTWRVFSTWANPTSLAGMLGIGLMLAIGLAIYIQGVNSAIPWTCGLAMACCMMVTDSRGGIYSMLVGLICLSGFAVFWGVSKDESKTSLIKIGSILVLAILFGRWAHPVAGMGHTAATAQIESPYVLAGQTTPAVATPAAAAPAAAPNDQSAGFRLLLWKGAWQLMKGNPVGYGFGTYRYESARPGLTTETQLTHNSYFQMGVETGFLGLLFFLAFLGLWLFEMVRGCHLPLRPISFLRMGGVMVGFYVLLEILSSFAHVEIFPTNTFKIVALGGVGLVWLYVEISRKMANLANKQNILRACIIAAVICCLADNLFESDLYCFGIGVTAFILMGLGLIQATDGIAPEFIPPLPRVVGVSGSICVALLLLHGGVVESLRARGRFERDSGLSLPIQSRESRDDLAEAGRLADLATSIAPFDGENWRLKGNVDPGMFDSAKDFKEAAELHPNVRNLRAYGIALMNEGDPSDAVPYFKDALELDPNNLLTLSNLLEAYTKTQNEDLAIETAKRTVAVEDTDYFKIRSLPELIPVETYDAHAFLGAMSHDLPGRVSELEKAMAGYQLYLQHTVPLIMQMAQTDPHAVYGGESVASAQFKMRKGAQIAAALADTYKNMNRPADMARVQQVERAFLQVAGPQPPAS